MPGSEGMISVLMGWTVCAGPGAMEVPDSDDRYTFCITIGHAEDLEHAL